MFFRKRELVDRLNRDLAHTRNKRDSLASSATTLSAQIAELEAQLSVETERRKRERVAGEIVHIKERVRERYLAFTPAIAGIRNATEAAETIDDRELTSDELDALSDKLLDVAIANKIQPMDGMVALTKALGTLISFQARQGYPAKELLRICNRVTSDFANRSLTVSLHRGPGSDAADPSF